MTKPIHTLLLCALPASGKSEVRRYMASLTEDQVRGDFHMGSTVQLDDYPYVHMMRRIAAELRDRDQDGIFFDSDDLPWKEKLDWGTLIELLNEDYRDLHERPSFEVSSAAAWLFDRIDRARKLVGATPALAQLDPALRGELLKALEEESRKLLNDKVADIPDTLDGKTIVIEFARGGADGSSFPLDPPVGYGYSFAQLSDEILANACVLYVWVTPEDSRRKNDERSKPGRDGDASILHHGVPIRVMMEDYGTDDMSYLLGESDRDHTVCVETRGNRYHLPVGRFDNRKDLTSFLREEQADWDASDVSAIHAALASALSDAVEAAG